MASGFFYVKQSMHVKETISETVIFIHRVNNAVGMVSSSESGQKKKEYCAQMFANTYSKRFTP